MFEQQSENEACHVPELSALEHQEILRNIELADEGPSARGMPEEGTWLDQLTSDEGGVRNV